MDEGRDLSPETRAPVRWRFAIFVAIGVYPIATSLIYLVGWAGPSLPIWMRSAIMVPIIVVAMVWGVIPFIQTRLVRWL